jgi:hypothetical protein
VAAARFGGDVGDGVARDDGDGPDEVGGELRSGERFRRPDGRDGVAHAAVVAAGLVLLSGVRCTEDDDEHERDERDDADDAAEIGTSQAVAEDSYHGVILGAPRARCHPEIREATARTSVLAER